MVRRKFEPAVNFLEPIKIGNERLVATVDTIAARCFEDRAHGDNLLPTNRVTNLTEALEVVNGYRKGDVGFSKGILRNMRLDDLDANGLLFTELLVKSYRATINYFNNESVKGEHGQEQWESGLEFGHRWKALFAFASENGWDQKEIWQLFDKVFEEKRMVRYMSETNVGGRTRGLEAELNAYLLLKEVHPGSEVKFADRELDSKKKVDILVISEDKIVLVQVKAVIGNLASSLSLEDREGTDIYLQNADTNGIRRKVEKNLNVFRRYTDEIQRGTDKKVEGVILFSPVRREKHQLNAVPRAQR